uniref:Uncharacterized protein n=1 Tax=Plectus sambesii TaxID=2011161 RepID=A0A914XAB4_9BILA
MVADGEKGARPGRDDEDRVCANDRRPSAVSTRKERPKNERRFFQPCPLLLTLARPPAHQAYLARRVVRLAPLTCRTVRSPQTVAGEGAVRGWARNEGGIGVQQLPSQ